MRQVSGTGSDVDGTDETLGQRENATRQRRGDDDVVLPGPAIQQRAPLNGSVFDPIEKLMTIMRAIRRVRRGTVAAMMTLMAAPPRVHGSEGVGPGIRGAALLAV